MYNLESSSGPTSLRQVMRPVMTWAALVGENKHGNLNSENTGIADEFLSGNIKMYCQITNISFTLLGNEIVYRRCSNYIFILD